MKDATRVGFASALYSLTKKEDLKSVDNALYEVLLLLEKVPELKKFLLSYDVSYENKKGKTYSVWNDEWDNYHPIYRESYEPNRFNYNNWNSIISSNN